MIASIGILLRLLIAHLIGDFFLQPKAWVKDRNKKHLKSSKLYLHALVHASLAWLVLWDIKHWKVAIIIFASHLLIDLFKSYQRGRNTLWFIVDQALHVVIILCVWRWLLVEDFKLDIIAMISDTKRLYVIAAFVILSRPASIFIGIATQKWRQEVEDDKKKTLKDAGLWIGVIERFLILIFILAKQDAAIGFLLAAKSIFRFGDLRKTEEKNQTEYLVIGTFLSFGMAVVVGYLLRLVGV
ncbi:DUF3307 domain-containing protein [Fulvivirga sp. 29W222]|uniref:DUF3307 domain-containing protein n=1 Tax=Fulvivirga marina TaxID=2494733 RepID=A0A937FZA6_9BACT|nr:DUF3307 domain-containing protein [Fulvivirga marina]MBL6445646.1 DUF3307 domain-containing protein [Fulvivirga marina]